VVVFLFGWIFFTVIQTATIAAVGVAFAKFTAYLIPQLSETLVTVDLGFITISPAQLLSILVIVLLTYINTRGVNSGKIVQTIFTMAKLLSLLGLIVFGLFAVKASVWSSNWHNAWTLHSLKADGSIASYTTLAALGAIASAMVGSIFSSDSWNNVTFIAGEVKNPKRNIGLSLALGTVIVTVIYILTNIMYTGVLSLHDIATADKDRVGVTASQQIFGSSGTIIIALLIMVSTFGCNNGLIMSGARVYYSMSKDKLFFKQVGILNKNSVPGFGLWLQCIFACLWSLSGKYGDLLDMISFVVVVFYVLTIIGIFILRKKMPDAERPYKAFGYPVLPVIYIIMGLTFCLLLIKYKPAYTWPGLIITLTGIPVYYLIGRTQQKKGAGESLLVND
jgi:APA family basic amino acid/polyamine antiporter